MVNDIYSLFCYFCTFLIYLYRDYTRMKRLIFQKSVERGKLKDIGYLSYNIGYFKMFSIFDI